jgi:steroid delta-isomerase-like uncharacterized protein
LLDVQLLREAVTNPHHQQEHRETVMKFGIYVAASSVIALAVLSSAQALSAEVPTPAQERLYRTNAPKFHKNFSAGEFEKNGPLVTEDIDMDSNNVKLVGRDNFVKRIERYNVPFPGLQLKDRVIVVDGNVAAVNYVLQGENKGPYGQLPPSGNRIEAMSGEVFEFNPEGLMKKLTTITEIDRVESEIKGTTKINAFQKITLLPTSEENSEYRAKIRSVAAQLHENFNSGKNDVNGALATEDIRVNADSRMLRGRQALIDLLKLLKTAFPDMNIRDEYVLADGNRAAVEYVMEGTQTGPYTLPDGSVLPASGRKVRVRGIEFMEFDKAALLKELVVVHNEHDFATQLSR